MIGWMGGRNRGDKGAKIGGVIKKKFFFGHFFWFFVLRGCGCCFRLWFSLVKFCCCLCFAMGCCVCLGSVFRVDFISVFVVCVFFLCVFFFCVFFVFVFFSFLVVSCRISLVVGSKKKRG